MGRVATILSGALLLVVVAGGAKAASPAPELTRAQAQAELQAAIEDEERALELLRKSPPRTDTARERARVSFGRLLGVSNFLSATPGAGGAESGIGSARHLDAEVDRLLYRYDAVAIDPQFVRKAIDNLLRALSFKRDALRSVSKAAPPPAVTQCSDGKDNDGDGITDWDLEPGCTSARDVREQSPFNCAFETSVVAGRLVLSGSCTGAFSEVSFEFLDGLQLSGRWDMLHAPSCSSRQTTVRCKTKTAKQNPRHLVEGRFTTTKRSRGQRVRMRVFDQRKREIRGFFVRVR